MKGLPNLIRLRRWALDEKRRDLAELERLRMRLEGEVTAIDAELLGEQETARRSVEFGYSYGGFAMAAVARRERVEQSLCTVDRQMEEAREAVAVAYRELKRFEHTQSQREVRTKHAARAREQAELDEVALNAFRHQHAK